MKKLILCLTVLFAIALFTGCETTASSREHSSHQDASPAATGQKCQVCDCKGYEPGKLIKGVCAHCGHTAAEHTPPTK